jgi:hypothetical protein
MSIVLCLLWFSVAYAADTVDKSPPPGSSQNVNVSKDLQNIPSIHLPKPTHDFGEVPEGEVVSHDFKVKNVGEEVLKIQRVRPG